MEYTCFLVRLNWLASLAQTAMCNLDLSELCSQQVPITKPS